MKIRFAFVCAAVLMAAGAWSQSAPICITHFNNQSDYRWAVYNADGRKTTIFIPAHTSATIGWGTTPNVTITGEIPNRRYIRQFSVQQASAAVVIVPQGTDQTLTLNQPGSGDITTCAGAC